MTMTAEDVRKPYSATETERIVADFHRDGFVHLGNFLAGDEITRLRGAIDDSFTDPEFADPDRQYSAFVIVRLFEVDQLFRDLLVREPLISLMEAMLGSDCHVIANNVVRNRPGEAISNFHIDTPVWFPLPDDVQRFPSTWQPPLYLVNVQIPLTDVPAVEYGPTEIVPGSHFSGRAPTDTQAPEFEGKTAVPMLAKAGDLYLQHPQAWHRGAPNTSKRTRYLLQQAYGRRFVAQRFYPFMNYIVPDHVLAGADERLLRVLGKHKKGPYG